MDIIILIVNSQIDLEIKIRFTCGCLIELNLNVVVSLFIIIMIKHAIIAYFSCLPFIEQKYPKWIQTG